MITTSTWTDKHRMDALDLDVFGAGHASVAVERPVLSTTGCPAVAGIGYATPGITVWRPPS